MSKIVIFEDAEDALERMQRVPTLPYDPVSQKHIIGINPELFDVLHFLNTKLETVVNRLDRIERNLNKYEDC